MVFCPGDYHFRRPWWSEPVESFPSPCNKDKKIITPSLPTLVRVFFLLTALFTAYKLVIIDKFRLTPRSCFFPKPYHRKYVFTGITKMATPTAWVTHLIREHPLLLFFYENVIFPWFLYTQVCAHIYTCSSTCTNMYMCGHTHALPRDTQGKRFLVATQFLIIYKFQMRILTLRLL